jgi:hypothetical protein
MATLHVAWITSTGGSQSDPGQCISDIISAETVTTSGTSAKSGVRPSNATHAVVSATDAAHYVTNAGLSADAAATNSVWIASGGYHVFAVNRDQKIAARTV